MTRPGTEAKALFVAALVTAIAGSVRAEVSDELGGDEAAAQLEATVTNARQREAADIEAVRRAGREAWEKHHGGAE